MTKPRETSALVDALVALIDPYVDRLRLVPSSSMACYTETKGKSYKGSGMMFAAVRDGKAYTSYHFFPLYLWPEMIDELSPALRKRMQGKTCFNFRAVDTVLFAELRELTERGFERYEAAGYL
ncbi:MAG: hypothetical protein WCE44_00145 [Candidatus Velthaea sp.]|jgi:hypothetical protein